MAKGSTEEQFLNGLTDLFLAEGVRNLTVGDIAERMHCSRRRLYGVARTKEEIFCAMVDRFFLGWLNEGELLIQGQRDLTAALAAYLNIGVRAGSRISASFLKDVEDIEAARASFDAYQQARAMGLSQLIDQGVREGVFMACHGLVVAESILGAALRLRRPAFLASADLTIEEAFEEFYRVLLGGLSADAALPGTSLHRSKAKGKVARATVPGDRPGCGPDDETNRLLMAAWNRP
ncbi:TetR/AcrR family transcriptional regulator [Hydrogenophaga sp.]|jgi:AcrR family transcriptional regulator|uniref:TetR/AcrR family transcriptional regulator n=1 Tax=Hydrogenophaga sp. TaxID=1904254 RepID=UPI0035B39D00